MKKTIQKGLIIWFVIIVVSPLVLYFAYFAYAGFSINLLFDQDKQALSYLKSRYGQDFTVIRNGGGDELGGSITYFKRLAPVADRSMEFSVERCLARCSPGESTEFSDSYPYAVWTKQETRTLQSNPIELGIPLDAMVSARLGGKPFAKNDTWMLAKTDTGVISYRDLLVSQRKPYTLYIGLAKRNPAPTKDDFLQFANTLVDVRSKMKERGLPLGQFVATIAPKEPLDDSGWRFYTYTYQSPNAGADTQTAEMIASQFKKEKIYDRKLYEQAKNTAKP